MFWEEFIEFWEVEIVLFFKMRNEEVYDFVNVVEGFDGLDDYFIVSVVLFLYVEFG